LLILDEPTSAIDTNSEELILRATENLTHGRTSFMIAHRLTTVRNCNILLVLKQGRLLLMTRDYEEAIRALQVSDAHA
jgi:ABC-type multidrug transport system fused ATPase/permease subunit